MTVVEADGGTGDFGGVPQDQRIVDNQFDDRELGQGLQEPAYLSEC